MRHKIIQLPDNWNRIMVVGEAPGADEEASVRYSEKHSCYIGKPFIGSEGQYLRAICRQVNFPFEDCIVTNTVHERPVKNQYESLSKSVVDAGIEELRNDIIKFNPTLILAIGGKALEPLCGVSAITKYRGSVLPCTLVDGYKVFATVHPGFIFRGMPQYDIVLKMDLRKVQKEIFPEIIYPKREVNVIYDKDEALKTLYDLCYCQQLTAVDIETAGSRFLAFGVATSKDYAIVIPKDLLKLSCVLKAVSEFCDSQTPKLFHNGLYDAFWLAYHYKIYTRNYKSDSMYAQHAIFPSLPKSLAFCSSLYTQQPYWKDEGKEVTKDYAPNKIIDWPSFYLYNGKDCCVTYEVFEKQQEELDYWGTRGIYELMMKEVDHALYSQLAGCNVNWANVKEFEKNNEKSIEVLDRIKKATIGDLNCSSSKQCGELLYDKWRLPERTKKGKRTTEDAAISFLESLPVVVQPCIGIISKMRELTKLRGYYDISVATDGKIHWSNKITGTSTGRWSTSKDIVTNTGMNLQNQPHSVHHFYEAPEGMIFIEWDLSNVDARFVAALCRDENWLASFDIIDNHSFNAINLFKTEPFYKEISNLSLDKDSLTKFASSHEKFLSDMYKAVRQNYDGDKTYRDYAKKIGHATNYLEGPVKLSLQLGCSQGEAKNHLTRYKALRPSLTEWHERVNREVGKSRIIRTFSGRVLQFFGPYYTWAQQLPAAVAAEPQSSAGDYLMIGGIEALETIPEISFSLQVHDSIRVVCKNDLGLLKTVLPKIKKCVEFTAHVKDIDMVVPAEFKIGRNWGTMKKLKSMDDIEEVYKEITQ